MTTELKKIQINKDNFSGYFGQGLGGGVYAYINQANEIIYIGSTINYSSRFYQSRYWIQALRRQNKIDSILLHRCRESTMRSLEKELIKKYSPPLNKAEKCIAGLHNRKSKSFKIPLYLDRKMNLLRAEFCDTRTLSEIGTEAIFLWVQKMEREKIEMKNVNHTR